METTTDAFADLVAALNTFTNPTPEGRADTGSYGYDYLTLDQLTDLARQVLGAHNLAVVQNVTGTDTRIHVHTFIYHSSGARFEFGPVSMAQGRDAQSSGSAITYARRYGLLAALGLASGDDDGAAHQPAEPPRADPTAPVMAAMKSLSADAKSELKLWADGRSLSAKELAGDPAWLEAVEAMVSSLQHHETPEDPF